MSLDGTLGGAVNDYIVTVLPPSPIHEYVTEFKDLFVPGSPPIVEGTPGSFISDIAQTYPTDPIYEGFASGLLDTIALYGQGGGLGDG